MQVIVKLFSVGGVPASDGSIIPRRVVEEYLASDKYREDIEKRKMIGSLTHRCRNWATQKTYDPSIARTAGKDDQMLTVGISASPTHYINSLWINDADSWVYAKVTILDEEGLDDEAVQNIRRLKGLLNQGIFIGVSAVILGYWSNGNGHDTLKKMVAMKGLDWTNNPSWVSAGAVEIVNDEGREVDLARMERRFSDTPMVKTFSNLNSLGVDSTIPRTSKIDGFYTVLKGKEFTCSSKIVLEEEEKTFSVATLKERIRYAKFSPRMRFRKLIIEYKQAVKAFAGKMDPETERIMKSMFATDVLDIIKTIHTDVMSGKQINTLLGCSSLGRTIREASQKLQIPYRNAMQEIQKTGKISPMRYKKIQDAYVDFIKALTEEVFGNSNEIPEDIEEEEMGNEKN